MSSRYVFNLLYVLLAAFIVVVSQSLGATTVGWLTFGVAVGFTVSGAALLVRNRGWADRALSGGVSVLGVLLILESLLASGSSLIWLSFAGALGVVALALAGLTLHELTTERVVHSFEPSAGEREQRSSIPA